MLTPDCSRSAAIGGNEPANCGSRLLPKGPYLRHRVMLITARLGGFQYPSEGNGRFRRRAVATGHSGEGLLTERTAVVRPWPLGDPSCPKAAAEGMARAAQF